MVTAVSTGCRATHGGAWQQPRDQAAQRPACGQMCGEGGLKSKAGFADTSHLLDPVEQWCVVSEPSGDKQSSQGPFCKKAGRRAECFEW